MSMKLLRVALASLSLAGLVSCASLRAHSDFDSEVDFGAYRTFAIVDPLPDDEARPTQDIVSSPLIERRVAARLREGLASRGFEERPAGSADLHVAFSVGSRRAGEVTTYPAGPWPGPWRYAHWERVAARIYTEGVLVVDLVDARTRRLVWRGWVTDAVSSRTDIDEEVRRAVAAILSELPPLGTATRNAGPGVETDWSHRS